MLAELLENIRIKKNWSYYRLAKELGITQTQLKHYLEKGGSTREELLIKIAELAGFPLKILLNQCINRL